MGKFVDRAGQKFGRLLVLEKSDQRNKSGSVKWHCVCDCGKKVLATGCSLNSGDTKSCGCLFIDVAANKGKSKKTHGLTKTNIYRVWSNMKNRCLNPNYKKYHAYGGRGIKVCIEWMNFENFYNDMGNVPQDLTLDRIDVNGHYNKENCRWATQKVQQNNRRNNISRKYAISEATIL